MLSFMWFLNFSSLVIVLSLWNLLNSKLVSFVCSSKHSVVKHSLEEEPHQPS
uniref:Uncharacterized protein n=1 Tax=Rhizophora mucronata TaxID=61149 RepID=A0A2P2ME00_RHIMU